MELVQKYPQILSELKPYIFSHEDNLQHFDFSLFKDKPQQYYPTDNNSFDFFTLLKQVDRLSFSESGMEMDNWVLLDCAIMPGAIFGFGVTKDKLPVKLLELMGVRDDYKGIIPISLFIAIPMANKTHWFAHNLSSLNKYLDSRISGLGIMTKFYGLKTLRISKLMAATQWNSDAIYIHSQIAPMKIHSAKTLIHSFEYSLIYESDYSNKESFHYKKTQALEVNNTEEIEKLDLCIKTGSEVHLLKKIDKSSVLIGFL